MLVWFVCVHSILTTSQDKQHRYCERLKHWHTQKISSYSEEAKNSFTGRRKKLLFLLFSAKQCLWSPEFNAFFLLLTDFHISQKELAFAWRGRWVFPLAFFFVFFFKVFLQRQDFSFLQCDFEAFCFLLQALNSRWSFSFYLRKIRRRKERVRKKVGQWRFEHSFLFWKRRRNWCVIEFLFIYFSFYFFFTSFEKWLKKLNV